jgi:hypothetical protein
MRTWRVLTVAAGVVVTTLALVGTAGANHLDMTVSPGGDASRVAGVYLQVPIDVTCPADLTSGQFSYVYEQRIDVFVTQKAGNAIARGTGTRLHYDDSLVGGGPVGTPLTCDGSAHTYTLDVFPSVGSGPFKGGKAVVRATLTVVLLDPVFFWTDFNIVESELQTIRIRG